MQWICRFTRKKPNLESWQDRAFSLGVEDGPRPSDQRAEYENIVAKESPGAPLPDGPFHRVADAIGRFDIFDPYWVTGVVRRIPIEIGDVIGVRAHLMPGLDVFFAARVIEVFNGETDGVWKAGFTYRTLHGHPVCGEETFSVDKDIATGEIRAALRSWSRPGGWLTWLGKPYMRWCQKRASLSALRHLHCSAKSYDERSLVGR